MEYPIENFDSSVRQGIVGSIDQEKGLKKKGNEEKEEELESLSIENKQLRGQLEVKEDELKTYKIMEKVKPDKALLEFHSIIEKKNSEILNLKSALLQKPERKESLQLSEEGKEKEIEVLKDEIKKKEESLNQCQYMIEKYELVLQLQEKKINSYEKDKKVPEDINKVVMINQQNIGKPLDFEEKKKLLDKIAELERKILQLTMINDKLTREIQDLKDLMNRKSDSPLKNKNVEELFEKLENSRKEKVELEIRFVEMNENMDKAKRLYEEDLIKQGKIVEQMTDLINQKGQENDSLKGKISKSEISELKLKNLENSKVDLENMLKKKETELEEFQKKIQTIDFFKNALNEKDMKIEELSNQIEEMNNAVDIKEKEKQEVFDKLKSSITLHEEMSQEKKDVETRVDLIKEKHDQLKDENEMLQSKVSEHSERTSKLQSHLSNLLNTNDEMQNLILSKSKVIEDDKTIIKALNETKEKLEQEKKELDSNFMMFKAEYDKLLQEKNVLEEKLLDASAEIQKLENLRPSLHGLKEELRSKEAEVEALKKEKEDILREIEVMKKEFEIAKNEIAEEKEQEKKVIMNELELLTLENHKNQLDKSKIYNENKKTADNCEILSKKLEEANDRILDLEKLSRSSLTTLNQKLQEKDDELRNANEERNHLLTSLNEWKDKLTLAQEKYETITHELLENEIKKHEEEKELLCKQINDYDEGIHALKEELKTKEEDLAHTIEKLKEFEGRYEKDIQAISDVIQEKMHKQYENETEKLKQKYEIGIKEKIDNRMSEILEKMVKMKNEKEDIENKYQLLEKAVQENAEKNEFNLNEQKKQIENE